MKINFRQFLIFSIFGCLLFQSQSCGDTPENKTAFQEQAATELNQAQLLANQPPPKVTWSLERDNLIKRFKLMNDKSILMYMYIFNLGVANPIGYYQVNKVSSVNSQLTNPMQIVVAGRTNGDVVNSNEILPSPAEDGSYGSNGDGVFGFTPDDVYIEHNMHYICATAPLNFASQPTNLGTIKLKDLEALHELMNKLK